MKTLILTLAATLALAAAPAPAAAETRDLAWASGLSDADAAALDAPALTEAIKVLWTSGYYEPDSPVKPTAKGYAEALLKARKLAQLLVKKDPASNDAINLLAMVDYDYGETLTSKDQRLKIYDEMVAVTDTCLARDAKNADCWHWRATALGRRGTTVGILTAARQADDIEAAWLKALALNPTTALPNGDKTSTNIRYGLTAFYRMVPDSFFMKMFTGTRGDKKKAVKYAREMAKAQPYRLEIEKELAVALVCYGNEEDDAASAKEGLALMQAIVDGKFDAHDLRLTDDLDKAQIKDMIAKPSLACAYSRDGYQDLDESKLKK
jgi:hypothetical protein